MTVRLLASGLAILAAVLIIGLWIPSGFPSAASDLTWRQQAIINTRAKVHGCQDELGVHRSPVAQRVIRGGPRYRAWVLFRWRMRLGFCRDAVRDLNANPVRAIMAVWGPQLGPSAVRIARCESGPYWPDRAHLAANGQFLGAFQMGEWARARYGHSYTPLGQARAAYANYRDNGWGQWACASILGIG